MDTATKIVLDALKTSSKKVDHEAAEATDEFIRNKIDDKNVKPKLVIDENSRNVEEIAILPEKRQKTLSKLRQEL